ncbi:MAG: tetratricopeptide repeat protein [Acidimicrobiia bacterium]|nr:tetratricopeptide repeat protein [Acidimicrobiia bacterium]
MRTDKAPAQGIGTMADAPRVFLSYSHDSDEHADRVLDLANALRRDGCDVLLDQYLHRGPEEGWPLWMDNHISEAKNFVLMVCTEGYLRRVRGKEKPGQGLGVRWEGKLIYNRIYHDQPSGSRFIPILLPGSGSKVAHIPTPVLGHNRYEITSFHHADSGYEGLYRHLVDKPKVIVPELGTPLGEPVVWNVPYPRNRNFTGRESVLAQLETALASGTPAALSQAIAGLGGVGKTQTAVEYAYRHRQQYRAVLWVRADTETDLASGYRALAEVLGLPEKGAQDSNEVAAAVRRWLGREPGYLLILDNANDPALVKPYLPPDPKGHVLLTSRAHNFDVLGIHESIGLPVLTPDEALAFLQKRTGRKGPLDPAEQEAARTLAEELGYLPLALEQAAAYMVEHEETFAVYLDAYRTLRLKLLDEMGPVAGEYLETVRTTWKRGFDAVAAASPAASALLRLSAFLAPDAIPYELILEGASELGEPLAPALASLPGGDHALNTLLTPLARHSLVRRAPEARAYSVHRLVQAVLLDELTAATREDLAERIVKALNRTFSDVDYADWPRCERLVPHALAARGWIEGEALRVPEAARLLSRAGYYLYHRARYAEAEPLLRRALALREQALGPDHPDTATCLHNLAALYDAQGRYAEAEPLRRRALAVHERALGPDHPATATSLNGLALLYDAQGRSAEAEPLYRRALAICEQALGPDHPHTALSPIPFNEA